MMICPKPPFTTATQKSGVSRGSPHRAAKCGGVVALIGGGPDEASERARGPFRFLIHFFSEEGERGGARRN
jgi:hypothetical protein